MQAERVPGTEVERPRAEFAYAAPTAVAAGSLVVVAVEDGDPEFAKAVEEQLSAVTAWWPTGPAPGQGFVQTVLRAPEERNDVERFLHTSGIRQAPEDEALVVYITSHGTVGRSLRHFLILPDTDTDRLLATGLPTNDVVVAAIDSRARHVLVIVNACEAEGIDAELKALVRELVDTPGARRSVNVVATTATRSPVLGREFAAVLRMAFDWLRDAAGITRPQLTISEFVQALEQATERLNAERDLALPGPRPVLLARLGEPSPALPNPGYRPRPKVVTGARAEVAATPEELEYWLDRASGRASSDDPGWYFSGRKEINRDLADFVAGPPGVLVVTGTAASGKSAVLARAVTLSDPAFRTSPRYADAVRKAPPDSVPGEGSIHVAVSARNRGPLDLMAAVGTRLGCARDRTRPGTDALRQWQESLRAFFTTCPTDVVTVVVDGLDESPDPVACVRDVLVPLAVHAGAGGPGRGLRLLLGVRSTSPGTPGAGVSGGLPGLYGLHGVHGPYGLLQELLSVFPGAHVLRTDSEGVQADIAAYVAALLSGVPWGGDDPAAVPSAAECVARHVGRSFLDARLAAEQLRRGDGMELLGDSRWLAGLDKGTVGLFEQDLDQVADDGLHRAEALALLRATAYGLGRGIPWAQVWPTVASELLGARIEHADDKIRRLLEGRLAGYLAHDVEDDHVVYRPAHEQLAGMLRRWAPEPGAAPVTGERVAAALAGLVKNDTVTVPHPYLRRYLAHHAAIGGALDDRHVPPPLLPWLTGDGVRGLLGLPLVPGAGRSWLTAWAAVEPYVQGADLASRCSSLHLARTAMRFPGRPHRLLPPAAAFAGSRISVLWSRWEPPANVLATLGRPGLALAPAAGPGGAALLAVGGASGSVEFVDAVSGAPVGDRVLAHDGDVRCLDFVPDATGGGALVSGSADGTVRIRETLRGALLGRTAFAGRTWVAAVAGCRDGAGSLVVAAVAGTGAVRLWREGAAERTADLTPHPSERAAFALTVVAAADGRPLLVGTGGTVRVWDIADLRLLYEYPVDVGAPVRSLARTTVPGLVATGHGDGSLTLWDVATGSRGVLRGAGEPVTALVGVRVDGVDLLAAAGPGAGIDLWDVGGVACGDGGSGGAGGAGGPGGAGGSGGSGGSGDSGGAGGSGNSGSAGDSGDSGSAGDSGDSSGASDSGDSGSASDSGDSSGAGVPVVPVARLTGHTDAVTALCSAPFHGTPPHGSRGSEETQGRPQGTVRTVETDHLLASTSRDHTVRLWDADTVRRALRDTAAAPAATAAALTSDLSGSPQLAVSDASARIQLRDLTSGEITSTVTTTRTSAGGPPHPPAALAWLPEEADRHVLLHTAPDHSIRSWDRLHGRAAGIRLEGHVQPVRALATTVAADGRRLAVSADDFTVRLWELDGGRQLQRWPHPYSVRTVAAVSDGSGTDWFASGGMDGRVRLWESNEERGHRWQPEATAPGRATAPSHVFRCRQGIINAVAINPHRTLLPPFLATGGDDGTVRLWDLTTRTALAEPLVGHTDAIEAITIWTARAEAPRPYVASASRDGTVRFWDAATSRCVLRLATGSPVHTLSVDPRGTSGGGVAVALAGQAGVAVLSLDLNDLPSADQDACAP
ncbi:hypothetical protein [Streptomyces sp. NPDC017941]|uniref:hypothetical protein n=1 Tax=Streptomyces sp. NPDC017941 TaxID=3365018 RepID=UPI0037926894